jgi:hypothetical protein
MLMAKSNKELESEIRELEKRVAALEEKLTPYSLVHIGDGIPFRNIGSKDYKPTAYDADLPDDTEGFESLRIAAGIGFIMPHPDGHKNVCAGYKVEYVAVDHPFVPVAYDADLPEE